MEGRVGDTGAVSKTLLYRRLWLEATSGPQTTLSTFMPASTFMPTSVIRGEKRDKLFSLQLELLEKKLLVKVPGSFILCLIPLSK